MPDVIVVGAGVIGAALARYLSRAGASVAVVDQNEVGGGTSSETFSPGNSWRRTG
jgi:glycine/D-amino acid oxidase-like deaminating enzyme